MQGESSNTNIALLTQLIEMGFPQSKVKLALATTASKEEAIAILLADSDQPLIQDKIQQEGDDDFEDDEQDYKMIFVVRMDLKLQLSKIAECVATGALKAYQQMQAFVDVDQLKEYAFFQWTEGGQRKIVVKSPSEKELLQVVERAKEKNINYALVYESPLNFKVSFPQINKKQPSKKQQPKQEMKSQMKQQKPLQRQVLILGAFGPAAQSEIDPLTKHFKLL